MRRNIWMKCEKKQQQTTWNSTQTEKKKKIEVHIRHENIRRTVYVPTTYVLIYYINFKLRLDLIHVFFFFRLRERDRVLSTEVNKQFISCIQLLTDRTLFSCASLIYCMHINFVKCCDYRGISSTLFENKESVREKRIHTHKQSVICKCPIITMFTIEWI